MNVRHNNLLFDPILFYSRKQQILWATSKTPRQKNTVACRFVSVCNVFSWGWFTEVKSWSKEFSQPIREQEQYTRSISKIIMSAVKRSPSVNTHSKAVTVRFSDHFCFSSTLKSFIFVPNKQNCCFLLLICTWNTIMTNWEHFANVLKIKN